MKIGMNLLLWTTHVTEEHFPLLAKLKSAGFDGVEVPLFAGDAAHYKKVRQALDNNGLGCTTITVATPEANPISPDPAIRQAAHDRHRWAIEMTHILGGDHLCGPYHSPLAVFSGSGPTEDEKKRAAEVLRRSAEVAKQANLTLAIEYLNRFECYFLTTARDARALVLAVNHPNFRTMYDTFHANIEEKNITEAIKGCADVCVHVHISENDRSTPGLGGVNWEETWKALKAVKFQGQLVIEAFGQGLPALAAATKIWRKMFKDEETLAKEGLAFMKKSWGVAAKPAPKAKTARKLVKAGRK